MKSLLHRLFSNPNPWHYVAYKAYRKRVLGYNREHYSYVISEAAKLAETLGVDRISVIEFGVAGGNGLVEIERICRALSGRTRVRFDIYGFDTGEGLPPPEDYRDLPHLWQKGFFRMDIDALKARLTTANLVMGDVRDTVPEFLAAEDHAPIGAVMFDLDYYSSTRDAFQLFASADRTKYLPRVQCYFDDIGTIPSLGANLAITEFNKGNQRKRIENPLTLRHQRDYRDWGWRIYEYHDFDHPQYCTQIVQDDQLPLTH